MTMTSDAQTAQGEQQLSPLQRVMLAASGGRAPVASQAAAASSASSAVAARAARGVVATASASQVGAVIAPATGIRIGQISESPKADISPAPSPAPAAHTQGAALLQAALANDAQRKKELATMASAKSLTRLLEAIYCRPGNAATAQEKQDALEKLSMQTRNVSQSYLDLLPPSFGRGSYAQAMAMDAVVTLQCRAWERGEDIDWEAHLKGAISHNDVVEASNMLAENVYQKATSKETMRDRLCISLHSAFWKVYQNGQVVNGLSEEMVARSVKEMAGHINQLAEQQSMVKSADLTVAWMQGSIGRIGDLFCAELRARQARDPQWSLDETSLLEALDQAKTGFQAVENFAQYLLVASEATSPTSAPGN